MRSVGVPVEVHLCVSRALDVSQLAVVGHDGRGGGIEGHVATSTHLL